MPRIPFTDLASSPEFKALPPEDQQVVATGYWDEVATEQPDQAEFYKGIRDVSKSLLDAKTKRNDASPVQRRFLDAQVQDLAFDLSLGDEFAQGRLTQEGYTEALKVRDTESAQRQAQLDKTRNLFSDDPAKQKALAIRLDGLEQTAITGGVFGSSPMKNFGDLATDVLTFNIDPDDGMVSSSRDAYAALKEQTAKDYGMEPDEVEDLVKHRLGFQEKPVSRDAVGNPFIKPEIMAQGPDAVKQAILNSDLPWREKQRMTAEGDLKERMDGYYKSTMEGVEKNHSELYKLYKLDLLQDDPKSGFSALTSSLNQDFGDKFASGFTGYTFGVAEQVAPAVSYLDPNVRIQAAAEGRDSEQAAQEARGRSQRVTGFARRAQESVNQLSQEFYKNQGTLWGVDASAYGSGAGSVLTAVGLGMATGGLALPVTSARVATMGPTALRMLNGANSVMRASPSIGLAMAQTGTSTYENALKSGKSEEEAGKLATLAGATEGVITGLFSLVGVGGLESVGEQLIGTAARQAVRDTAKSGFRTFGEKMLKGVTAEQFEEGMIAAFDAATVQARINPNMTAEDFGNTLRETALVTLAVSGPTIGMGALKETLTEKATYQQTDDEIKLRADLNLADATDPLRDRVRREGGVGTPLGERLRLTRPSARGTVPLEGTIPSDVVTDVNGVPVIPDDATNRIDTTATQPGQANIPPAGQGPANAPPDSGVAAPGAPAPVAPGGTQPVAPAQGPTGAPAAVPGVQPVGAAQPVLVRSDAEVDREMVNRNLVPPNPMLTPEERQADLQNRAPDLAAPAAPAASGLSPQAIAAGAVPAPTRSPAAPAPLPPQERRQLFKEAEDIIDAKDPVAQIEIKERFDRMKRRHDDARRELEEATTPGDKRRAELDMMDDENAIRRLVGLPEVETQAPITEEDQRKEAARQKAVLDELDAKIARGEPLTDEDRKAWVMEGRKKEDLPTPAVSPQAPLEPAAEVTYEAENGDRLPAKVYGVNPDGTYNLLVSGFGVVTRVPRNRLEPTTPTTDETKVPNQVEEASGLPPVEGQPVVPSPAVQAEEGTAQREGQGPQEVVEEAPAEGAPAEAEPDYAEVFEVLNDRDPDTKPINTESSKFRELVNSLKDTRVGELAGRLFQKKADVAEMRAEVKAAREAREKEFRKEQKAIKERRKAKRAEKPLDKHRQRIIELTKDEKFPQGRNPDYQKGLREWLRARDYDASIKKKGFLDGLLGYVRPLRVAKRERFQNLYASLTPEVKEMLDAIYKKPEKPAEEIPIFAKFRETEIGEKLLDAPIRSISSFRDAGEKMPVDYEGLVENRIKAHVRTRVFTRDPNAPTIEDLLESLNTKYGKGVTTGSMYSTGIYSAEDIVKAIKDLSEGNVKSQEDYDARMEKEFQEFEKQQQEQEDREIAFAEQQIKALENKVQTVDLRQVRKGDVFTLGGTEYTATGVEADKRGQTESFTLRGDGPLEGTTVSEDFFAESVTPTKGSLAHVDPAEIEAINIAQAFPEEFEDAAEPAPTATEPAVEPEAEPAPEPAAPAPEPAAPAPQAAAPEPAAPAPAPQPQATTPPPPAEPTPPQARPVQPEMAEVVSTQNAATDAWREANGFPPIFKNNPVTFTQYWQDAQKLLKQDPDAGKKLVARMKKALFQPDTSQVMLILNEMLMAKGAMERALYERNLQGESATADQIAAVNDALAYYAEMTLLNSRVGSIQATAFGARKVFVTDELDIGVIAGRIQHAQGGKKLSEKQSDELKAAYAKIKEFEDREKVREAEAAEDNAQQVFENMVVSEFKKDLREGQKQGEKPLTALQRKAQESREWLRQNIQGRTNMTYLPAQEAYHVAVVGVSYIVDGASTIGAFVTRLIKDFGNRYLPFVGDIYKKSQELHQAVVPKAKKIKPRQEILDGIDPGEMVNGKAIYQLVRHYVNEGLQTFEEVMTAVHADLQLSHPNLTMREVHDAFSNYGIVTQPSQEKDAKTARKYREMARYSSQLEDAMAKSYPKKTGPQRDPQEQEVRDLAKQVRDTIRKFNLRPKNDKEQLKSTFDAIKTRLKNEFEDYDTAVKKSKERKAREPQKFTAEEEAELKDLREKRDDRKKDYEAIFKKKGLTTEQRIERMEALLDRRIEEERKMLEEGVLKRDREMQMGPWTPALRKQQETLNKLKADRRERQKAARPKKPEDIKDYERKLKSLDKRIKEEEDLLAAGLTARQKNFKMGRWTPQMAEMQARLDALRDDRRELAKKQAPKKSEEQTAYERSVRAIEAAIQRYNDIINAIKKPGTPTFTRTLDSEMKSLLDQRDALRDAADAVLEADPERKDKRKQDLLKVLNRSINEITRKIQDGDFSTKTRKPGEFDTDPDVVKIREARDLLNKTLTAMRKVDPDAAKKQLRDMIAKREAELSKGITLPDTEEDPFAGDEEIQNLRTALDLLTDIKRIKTSTAKIQARLDAKDYTKSVKPTPKTSKAREDAIMEHNRLKSELNRMVIQTELDNRSFGQLVGDRTKDLLFNVSRTLNTSADAGTIGRQTQLVAFTRPGVWAKSLPSHFAFAKKHAERVQARVENHPDYDVAVQAGMNLGSWQEGATFEQMNEEMRSEVLRLVPGVGKVAGAVVDASIRAYVSGINSVRMPYFSLLYRTLIGERKGFSAKLTNKLGGVGLGTQKEIEYLARHVEVMTGRGNLRSAAKSAEFLAQILFSPRYWLSRLQIIGHFPVLAADLMTGFQFFPETRAARKVVAMEYARMAIGVAVYYNFLSMVKHLRGWDDDEMYIEEDPRSSDFGKVKIGNTRIDPMAGMLQNLVFVSRTGAWMLRGTEFGREAIDGDKIVAGKMTSMRDAVGNRAKIGDTMGGTMLKMIQTKLAPWPSAIFNVAFGEDAVGNTAQMETEFLGLYLPLSQVEIYNAMQEHGANPGLIYSATNLLGWGVSTYGPGTKKTTLEQDAFILMGVDQSRYERDDAKKAPGWKIPKSKGLPTF